MHQRTTQRKEPVKVPIIAILITAGAIVSAVALARSNATEPLAISTQPHETVDLADSLEAGTVRTTLPLQLPTEIPSATPAATYPPQLTEGADVRLVDDPESAMPATPTPVVAMTTAAIVQQRAGTAPPETKVGEVLPLEAVKPDATRRALPLEVGSGAVALPVTTTPTVVPNPPPSTAIPTSPPTTPTSAPTPTAEPIIAESLSNALTVEATPTEPVATPTTSTDLAPMAPLEQMEAYILSEINEVRAKAGVGPVEFSQEVSKISRDWSRQMAATGSISHRPSAELGAALPKGWNAWGENVASAPDVYWAQHALENSQGHYANMINPSYNVVGLGLHLENQTLWVTQNFVGY